MSKASGDRLSRLHSSLSLSLSVSLCLSLTLSVSLSLSLTPLLSKSLSHLGDFGTPIGLVVGEMLVNSLSFEKISQYSLSELYVKAKERVAADPTFHDFGKSICSLYQLHLLSLPLPPSVNYLSATYDSSVFRRETERE
jgi:hypothetical protein